MTMTGTTTRIVTALAALAMLATMAVAPAAAASYDTDYSEDGNVTVSESVDVTDSLEAVYLETTTNATIDNTDSTTDVQFFISGVNESADQNETVLLDVTQTVDANATHEERYDVTDSDLSDYETLYLHVESVNADPENLDDSSFGTVVKNSGGGFFLGDSPPVLAGGLAILAIGLAVIGLKD